MLVSNKHFTPVIGLDIHIVILFGFPIPLPHPYIGFVLDVADYIPFLGATTKINHVPRGKSDTSGIFIILFHIPMGGPFLLAPLIGHDSVNFFGSKRVHVEGNYMSPAGHMLMTCSDIGLPLGFSFKPGKKKPFPSMYLPTSFAIPLSFGKPVMVGGPFVPDWAGALLNLVMSLGFGAALKGLGKLAKKAKLDKLGKKGATKFNHAIKKLPGTKKLSNYLCKKGFEPVDLVQGIVMCEDFDFEMAGPIPLRWNRSWYSDSDFEGPLGHDTYLGYDMRIQEMPLEDATIVLLGDGRNALFEQLPYNGNSDYNRHEKLTLTRTDLDAYELYNHAEEQYYNFRKLHPQDEHYRLYAIRNEAGFMISLYYNNHGQLTRIIDSAGRHLHIDNDRAGRITCVTARHRGQEQVMVRYGYNEAGDLSEITDALEQTTRIQYSDHLMTAQTDRNGQTFQWEYDGEGRCVHTWGDDGFLEGFIAYHPSKGYNLVTNSLGQTSTYYYTPDFVVSQIKNPEGNSIFFEYTDDFELYREIDEEGNVTGYTYDERGNPLTIEMPNGSAFSYAYNEKDKLVLAATPEGGSRAFVYYRDGQLHTLTEADGTISIFNYNEQQLLSEIEDEQGRMTLLTYDEDFNLSTLTLPDGGISTWQYDAWGRCLATRNPLEQEQRYSYDELGRVRQVLLTDGNQVQLQYDAYDEVTEATDRFRRQRYAYTPLGSLKMQEEDGKKTHFVYNTAEQLTAVVNEHGESYRFVRNGRGDIIRETGFDGLTFDYIRDASGKVLKIQRPGKRWTSYEYDYNGRVTRTEHHDGSWEMYNYNRAGLLMEAINEHSTVKFERDIMGRITQEWQNGHTVSSTYDPDAAGVPRSLLQSSLGASIRFDRNEVGEVSGITAQTEAQQAPWIAHIQRNLLGYETERILPGGVTSSWSYSATGLPDAHNVNSGHRTTRKRHYRWDAGQRLRQLIDGINGKTSQFGYDDFGNLAWARYENGEQDYRLPDKAGNLYRTQGRNDRKYTAGGQLLESDTARYQYDEEGNLLKKITADLKEWQYEWYGNGMLKQVTRPEGKTVTFRYDPLGRRIEKEYKDRITRFVWDGHVPLHEWTYDSSDRPHVTIDELGDIQQSHPEPIPADTLITWVFENNTFTPAAKIVGKRQYSIIADHLGTPCEAYDENGEKIWACELDIYGKVRKFSGDKHMIPFRYPGQYEDAETGLYYNRFRYYSPEEGMYISQDPIRLFGGNVLYGYTSNPLVFVDIFGLNSTKLDKALKGVKGDDLQAQHLIPEQIWSQNQSFFDKMRMERDAAENGMHMPSSVPKSQSMNDAIIHRGSHPQYSAMVASKVGDIRDAYRAGDISLKEARKAMTGLQRSLRFDTEMKLRNIPIKPTKCAKGIKLA